jgi:hypothetical protein
MKRLAGVGLGVLVAAAGSVSTVLADAPTSQPSKADLEAQVQALQARVAQLEQQQQKQQQLQQQSNAATTAESASLLETDRTAQAVIRDAEHRSALQVPTLGNYQDGRFVLESDNGDFVLRPWFQLQVRYATTYRQEAPPNGDDDTQSGFEIRRMKFGFDGNMWGKDLTYYFNWATNRNNGTPLLEEAWFQYKFAPEWAVRAGQIKDPFAHESLTSSKKLVAAERSLLGDTLGFGDNYVQAASLIYNAGNALTTEFAFTDGIGSVNTDFEDLPTNTTDWGVAGRVQYKFFGKWANYEDFSAMGTKDPLLVIGGALDLTQGGDTNLFSQTADVQYELPNGLALYGAYLGQYINNSATTGADVYNWGGLGQISYLIPNTKWEPFGRADYIRLDGAGQPAGTELNVWELTAGVNYYFAGHAAKFTLDGTWLPNGSPIADTGADILVDNGNNEIVIRVQFQLLI